MSLAGVASMTQVLRTAQCAINLGANVSLRVDDPQPVGVQMTETEIKLSVAEYDQTLYALGVSFTERVGVNERDTPLLLWIGSCADLFRHVTKSLTGAL